MVKQISLDAWQVNHLTGLLRKGSKIVEQTNKPIVLYRQTFDEEEGSYEEIVCSLTRNYIVEQLVASGGMIIPAFRQQHVYTIDDYPKIILRKSRDRFMEIIDLLEKEVQ